MTRAILVAILAPAALAQDFHVEASRTAIVRDDHDVDAGELLRLARGDRLNCVTDQQTESFYNVFLPDGETGWVSRFVVRLHDGAAPEEHIGGDDADEPEELTASEREWSEFHLRAGAPGGYHTLVRPGYVAGYDPRLKIPVWVQYRLTEQRSDDNTFPRTDDFQEDGDVHSDGRSTLDDYAEATGYVRGHMAPAEDMRWDEQAELESNLLTNMAPQIGSAFNGSVWKTIENRVRTWAQERDEITVICGPVFEPRDTVAPIDRQPASDRQVVYNVVGAGDVAVPTGFFKIVADLTDPDHPDVIAFLVTHVETEAGSAERDPAHWLRSVDEIERRTGLDFLTALPEAVQRDLERQPAPEMW
jgi:endonuclease G